jgi:DNA primase
MGVIPEDQGPGVYKGRCGPLRASLRTRKGGDELAGLCPFHGPGKSRDPFRVSLSKNNWHCFQCDRGGNVLDFVAERESVGIREAALTIQQWFGHARPTDMAESSSATGAVA